MEEENKNLTKALNKYATSRCWSKSLDPCCVVKDKYGAVLYQYDKQGNFIYFYDSIEEYERCICHLD